SDPRTARRSRNRAPQAGPSNFLQHVSPMEELGVNCCTCGQVSESRLRCECDLLHCPPCFDRHICGDRERGNAGGSLWPHQERGVELITRAVRSGRKAILVTSPTGGGKTRIMTEIASRAVAKGRRVVLFTNRRLLAGQASAVLTGQGIDHGLMAAGHQAALLKGVQVCSLQTIASRVFRKEAWDLPQADVCLIYEAH